MILALCATMAQGQSMSDLAIDPAAVRAGDTIILGFLGAWERWDDENRGARKLALKLRAEQEPGIHVETLSNHKRHVALELIRTALDSNRDGVIDDNERSAIRIVLYGQSLGGSAVIKLARALDSINVPVLLTVQIDSVGLTDATVPKNVASAANLHQQGRFWFRGQDAIHAADPEKTKIVENTRYHYPIGRDEGHAETWARRRLGGGHSRMEADPAVWRHVERLIRSALNELQ